MAKISKKDLAIQTSVTVVSSAAGVAAYHALDWAIDKVLDKIYGPKESSKPKTSLLARKSKPKKKKKAA